MRHWAAIAITLLAQSMGWAGTFRYAYDFDAEWSRETWTGEVVLTPGAPRIPRVDVRLLLPFEEDPVSVRFVARAATRGTRQTFRLNPIPQPLCGKPDRSRTPPLVSGHFPDAPMGGHAVVVKNGYRLLYATLFPLQIDLESGETWRIPGGELVVETRPAPGSPLYRGLPADREAILSLVDPQLRNERALETYPRNRLAATADYLAIAPRFVLSDTAEQSLSQLLAEKQRRGIRTVTLALEDIASPVPLIDTQQKIRDVIAKYYREQGIQYVLLVGNGYSIAPTKNLKVDLHDNKGPVAIGSDLYYACLDGDFQSQTPDLACEVAVGRAPITTLEDVHAFVAKTLLMQSLENGDARLQNELNFGELLDPKTLGSSLIKQLLTGGVAGTLTTAGYPQSTIFREMYETLTMQYQANTLIDEINAGKYYTINHVGHADVNYCMKFNLQAIKLLVNDIPFFAITQGCHAGDLSMRNWASSLVVSPSGGAGAVIANSHNGFYNEGSSDGPSNRFHLAFYDAVFRDHLHQIGKIHFRAKEKLLPQLTGDDGHMRWVIYETNLLGDPELELKLSQ